MAPGIGKEIADIFTKIIVRAIIVSVTIGAATSFIYFQVHKVNESAWISGCMSEGYTQAQCVQLKQATTNSKG